MALVVSARNIDRYLNAKDKSFDAELRLPDGLVGLELEAVYFKKTLSGAVATYTIGSRFTNAQGQAHARLAQFLQGLPPSSANN